MILNHCIYDMNHEIIYIMKYSNYFLVRKLFIICILNNSINLGLLNSQQSQESPNPNTRVVMPEVEVSESEPSLTVPSAQKMQELLNELPASSNLIEAKRVRQGRAATLQDLFLFQPGIWTQPGFTGPNAYRISIRGSGLSTGAGTERGIWFLQDGIPLNPPDGVLFNQGQFDPLAYQYSVISRGAEAFNYGFATLFGAVNFVTYTGYTAPPYSAYFTAGSFGWLQGSIEAAGVESKTDYFAVLSDASAEGYRFHNSFNNAWLNTNIGYKITSSIENRIYFTYSNQQWQVPGPLALEEVLTDPTTANPAYVEGDYRQFWDTTRVADKATYIIDPNQTVNMGISWTNLHQITFYGLFFQSSNNFFSLPCNYTNTMDLYGHRNLIVAGVMPMGEFYQENWNRLLGTIQGTPMATYNMTVVNIPIYAYDQFWVNEKFSINLALQAVYDRMTNEAFKDLLHRSVDTTLTFSQFNPKLGLLYQVDPHNQLYASVARSFEPPSLYETAISPTALPPNLALYPNRAQNAITAEIGTRGQWDRFNWSFAFFQSWVTNELLEASLNPPLNTLIYTINAPPTTHRGIEISLNTTLAKGLMVSNSDSQNQDQIVLYQIFDWYRFYLNGNFFSPTTHQEIPLRGNQLFGVPEYSYMAQMLYMHPSGFYIGPNVMAWSTYPVDLVNTAFAPGTALLGFRIGYQNPKKHLSIYLDGRNLTNEHYVAMVSDVFDASNGGKIPLSKQTYYWPGDGWAIYGGISWNF